jgi:ribulose-5-phosphate 4-epimerase/fuculose-1-phosphate aldolase
MEPTRRIKFKTNFLSKEIPNEKEIEELKNWCNQFQKNNLTPEFQGASVGNLSTRIEDYFIITASVVKSKDNLKNDSFVRVINYDVYNNVFFVEGMLEPSSESIMHFLIYNTRDDVNAIFHGHSDLILKNAAKLKIPVTKNEQPPGTMELANEVLDVLGNNNIIIIKNGGFVSLGGTMKEAGDLAIKILKKAQSLK